MPFSQMCSTFSSFDSPFYKSSSTSLSLSTPLSFPVKPLENTLTSKFSQKCNSTRTFTPTVQVTENVFNNPFFKSSENIRVKRPEIEQIIPLIDDVPPDTKDNTLVDRVGMFRFWRVIKNKNKTIYFSGKSMLENLYSYYVKRDPITGKLDKSMLEKLIVFRALKTCGKLNDYEIPFEFEKQVKLQSLRSIEWLITNYSKKGIVINGINILDSYNRQLNCYKRDLFDVFCRTDRVYFNWKLIHKETKEIHTLTLMTSVGQLHSLKWAQETGVLDYARMDAENIEIDMSQKLYKANKEKEQFKKMGIRRRRKCLSQRPPTLCSVLPITHDEEMFE